MNLLDSNVSKQQARQTESLRKSMDAAAKAVQFLSVGLRCQKFEGGMRAEGEDIDVRIRHNYAKTGGRGGEGSGEIKTARTGPDKLLDLWIHGGGAQGGGEGEERRGRCLDPPRCVIVEISPVASEKGAKPERNRPRM